jgi:calcineurin-like phosphoesterase family protein
VRSVTRPSSRLSLEGAGWEPQPDELGHFQLLCRRERGWLSWFPTWLRPRAWLAARNEKLVLFTRGLGRFAIPDPTTAQRRLWLEELGRPALTVRAPSRRRHSFLLVGDSGEGDCSQMAVVTPLLNEDRRRRTDFMLILSDVLYPAGDVNEYREKLYEPYRRYPGPIYGIPGNHDWDDGSLHGFMFHFCGVATAPSAAVERAAGSRLWHRSGEARPELEQARRSRESLRGPWPAQPGPYFALDLGPFLVVAIDTGLGRTIDGEQGAWLREISRVPKPKLLLTGRPIYVDGTYAPCAIEDDSGTVDEIVLDPDHGYLAAIGGDIHNYQRYPVSVGGGRRIQYVVSGGGGAFMNGTHGIGNVGRALGGVEEPDFRCYPLRGDSLAFFSEIYDSRLGGFGLLALEPDEAAAALGGRYGIAPTRPEACRTEPSAKTRLRVPVVLALESFFRKTLSFVYYPALDRDTAPFFKSFLRVDVEPDDLRIRCFGATGLLRHETDLPLEDDLRWTPERGWTVSRATLQPRGDSGVEGSVDVYREPGARDATLVVATEDSPGLELLLGVKPGVWRDRRPLGEPIVVERWVEQGYRVTGLASGGEVVAEGMFV